MLNKEWWTVMKSWRGITHYLQKYVTLIFLTRNSWYCREKDRETEDEDLDWRRTAILTHIFLTTLCHIQGPHLTPILLFGQVTLGSLASSPLVTRWLWLSWLCVSLINRGWPSDVVARVYIISIHLTVRVVNPCDPLLVVNLREQLTFTHPCLPVISLFTQLEHPASETLDWRLCQRSIYKSDPEQ